MTQKNSGTRNAVTPSSRSSIIGAMSVRERARPVMYAPMIIASPCFSNIPARRRAMPNANMEKS